MIHRERADGLALTSAMPWADPKDCASVRQGACQHFCLGYHLKSGHS
jgi:hypothetical protein